MSGTLLPNDFNKPDCSALSLTFLCEGSQELVVEWVIIGYCRDTALEPDGILKSVSMCEDMGLLRAGIAFFDRALAYATGLIIDESETSSW